MSKLPHVPYTYLIGWSKLNSWYYGACWGKRAHPSTFWIRYKTSSKEVKRMISKYGNPDVIQVRKEFTSADAAYQHETTVLRRMKVQQSSKWLNMHENLGLSSPSTRPNKRKGWMGARDGEGNYLGEVRCEDPRFVTGEIVVAVGEWGAYKDGNGNKFVLSCKDPKIEELGLIGFGTGSRKSEHEKQAQSVRCREMINNGSHNFITNHPMRNPINVLKHKEVMKELAARGETNFQKNNPMKDPILRAEYNKRKNAMFSERNEVNRQLASIGPKINCVVLKMRSQLINIAKVIESEGHSLEHWDQLVYNLFKAGKISSSFSWKTVIKYFGQRGIPSGY